MFKKIAIGLGLIIVVIAVGIYYLSQNAGKIVEAVIEDQGTRVTQVSVALDGVDISLTDLKAGLRGLTVANPAGFKTARAVSLGEISVKLSKDWGPNLIVVEEVMVRAPEITYEIGAGGSNIATIQNNVQNFMKVMGGSGDSGGSKSTGGDETKPKVVIDDLYIKGGKVNVSASLMQGRTLTTPLPDIHLKDIGKDSGGATPAEIVDQVIAAITKSSGNAASALDLSQLGLADISGTAAEIGGKATEAVQDAAKGVLEGAGGAAGDAAKNAVGGATGALKGLFGK